MDSKADFRAVFYQSLPHKPYCSEDLGQGLIIRPKKTAIQMPYIQHNPPCFINSFVFDVDKYDAFFSWSDANLPPPNWISKNTKNGHAHIAYTLAAPVCTTHRAKQKIIEYAAKIEQGYRIALGADSGYSGLITKNPCNDTWDTYIFNVKPYELNYLADFIELQELKTDLREVSGLGRNCVMFDTVRFWAYRAVRQYLNSRFDNWHTAVLEQAMSANGEFLEPLPYSEVKATAKSISRWVWRNHAQAYATFIERQSTKGKLGATVANSRGACNAGGKARAQQYSDMRQEAVKLHIMGKSIKEISEFLGVHRNSVSNWIKNHAQVPS